MDEAIARIHTQKQKLREEIGTALSQMDDRERNQQAAEVLNVLELLPEWREADSILGYFPLRGEFPLIPILEKAYTQGKSVYLPRVQSRVQGSSLSFVLWEYLRENELEKGAYGVRATKKLTPVWNASTGELSLILVPGIAFTPEGGRLGRGAGFYDRFLARHPQLHSLAPCFSPQVHNCLPLLPHDAAVKRVIYSV